MLSLKDILHELHTLLGETFGNFYNSLITKPKQVHVLTLSYKKLDECLLCIYTACHSAIVPLLDKDAIYEQQRGEICNCRSSSYLDAMHVAKQLLLYHDLNLFNNPGVFMKI